MHINELVLDNFKSFGRTTRIPFYENFTTISGPNGSGKSNIIDAMLFALGLARTSGIRAGKLTDLIHDPGGEDGGFTGEREASVEVVLDNTDRTLSREQVVSAAGTDDVGDVDEITVRRRVKQTDEDTYYSYYYLNGRSVNLSDIRDLLATAGVTPEGYNVVMQGDVTEIITTTPRARREIIDEIAGVAEFDAKKADAIEELEVVQDRIDAADLRIEEKRRRLDELEDERETALQYRELKERKAEYESHLKAAELEDKREELAEARGTIEEREAEAERLRRELDERRGRVTRLEEDLADLDREIERKGEDEQLAIKREIEEIKGEIARLNDRIETQEERISDAEETRSKAFVRIDRKQETIADLEAEIRETKVEKSALKADLAELRDDLASVEAEIEAADGEYDRLRADLEAARERAEELRAEKSELQRDQDRLLDEARRRKRAERETREAVETARDQLPEVDAEISDLEAELEKAEHNLETIEGVIADLADEKRALNDDLEAVEDEIAARQREYAELEARADEAGDSSFGRAVTAVLNADLDGVHGPVATLGSVDPDYAEACETAAGGRMAHVVVGDDDAGERCIELLKRRNAGRATFLPLTEMSERSLPSPPAAPGVVDFAYELVEFDPAYAGVFAHVLGDTLVVEDMPTARDLMGRFRLVTLDGDLVEKSGAMTGGSTSGSRYSFSTSGEGKLRRLGERIQELEERRADIREEISDIEDRLADARDRKADAADRVRDVEAALDRKREERASIEAEIEDLEADLAEIEAERESVADEMDDVEERIGDKEVEIADAEAEIDELREKLDDSAVRELNERAEALRGEIDDLESRMGELDADLNELGLEKEYAEEDVEELRGEIEAAQNRRAEAEERIEELRGEIDEREATLAEKRAAVEELESELAELKNERGGVREELRAAEADRDETRTALDDVEADLDALRERAERLAWEIEELESEVGEYDPEEVPDAAAVKGQITKLDNRMTDLEPVNMLAIDEYERVSDELDDLEEQRGTLAAEAEGIRDRIERFETNKRATFMDAFEGINEQFRDIFARLSDGTGELVLESPDDPFEGGLTMKARPADKPVQRLEAMSGGEKSLTALAFIFAIQRYEPAPFYALDEVDAFLDAANAEMVGEMVDDLAGAAQFIVVSHRAALLERSERAIGVTMPEDNVSAVTGVDLSGGEVPADD